MLFILLVLPGLLRAATITWTGATNTDWTIGSNWGGTAPADGDDVLIPGGLSNYPVISTDVTLNTLVINNSGSGATLTETAGGSLTLTGSLTINGTGTFVLMDGIASIYELIISGELVIQGGTITTDNDIQVSGTLTQSGGIVWLAMDTFTDPNWNLVLSGGTVTQSGGAIHTQDYDPLSGTFNQTGPGSLFQIFRYWQPGSGNTFNATGGTVQFTGPMGITADFTSPNTQFFHVITDAFFNEIIDLDPVYKPVIRMKGNFRNNSASGLGATDSLYFLFNGTTAQTISSNAGSNVTISNLEINNSGANVSLVSGINMNGGLIVRAGSTFDLSTFNLGASAAPDSVVLECGAPAGSSMTGSGTLTLGGDLTVHNLGTGNGGASIAVPVALGATRTFTVSDDGTSAADLTVSRIISGAFGLTKAGAGEMVLTGSNTYSGTTTISAGVLTFNASGVIADGSAINLNGGTLKTGATSGFNESVGTLNLNATSTIALGTGSHTLGFAASNAVSWPGITYITITGWSGAYNGTSGTAGKIKVGTSASGLTSGQLGRIRFFDGTGYYAATILADGEVVPLSTPHAPTNLSYPSPNYFLKGTAITPINPTVTGSVESYSVNPSLPAGLTLDNLTGIISGTPSAVSAQNTYTVTAANISGSTTFNVSIVVGDKIQTGGSGNWSSTVINSPWPNGIVPDQWDDVEIRGGHIVTVDLNNAICNSILIGNDDGIAHLNFSGSNPSLTVVSNVDVGGPLNASRSGVITFTSDAALIAGSVSLNKNYNGTTFSQIDMTAGGLLQTGSFAVAGTYNTAPYALWTPGAGSVELTSTNTLPAEIFSSFNNLRISSGTTTTGTAIPTVTGTLTVDGGAIFSLAHPVGASAGPASTILEWGLAGSSITGSGTLTLGGPVDVGYLASGSSSALISCPLALGASRVFTVAGDGATSATGLTVSGVIGGPAFGVTKAGAGTMVLSGADTYTGGTTITSGTLTLGAADRLADTGPVTLGGGTFRTGTTTGHSETAGTLALTDNSTIALGTGTHTLTFAASSGISWTFDKTLTITGWTGSYNGTSGTSGRIFAGSSATGLTTTQLGQIQFYDGTYNYPATILASGEVVPAGIITSIRSGNWTNPNTWNCGCVPGASDFVRIGTHIVTLNQNAAITDINVTSGGILTSSGKTLTISRNLTIDGAITVDLKIDMTGTNTISGTGIINSGELNFKGGNKTISSGTSIDNSAASLSTINIDANVTVINNGFWIAGAKINGADASSVWVQGANSSLRVGNELLNNGTLDASATGNTVEYYRDGNQKVKTVSGAYYNLTISGADKKELSADIDINGSFHIVSGTFDSKGYSMNVAGNWTNGGGFTEDNSVVIFDGDGEQTLSVSGGETFYNFQSNNSGAGIVSTDPILVTHSLTMTAGIIDMGSSRITLGTSAANEGTLTHTAGYIIGEFERWHNPGPASYLFPVGTALNERTAVFTNVSSSNPGASSGSLIIKFVEENPGNIAAPPLVDGAVNLYNVFSEGCWDLQLANGLATGTLGTSLYLTGNGFTSHTIDAQTRSVYRPNSSAAWAVTGVSAGNTGNEIRRSGIPNTTQSGQWALADHTNCTAPVTPVITGSNAVCYSDLGEIYAVTDQGDTYTWTVTGGSISAGQSTGSITVDWGAVGMEGSVAVVAGNACTRTFPVTFPVDIGPLPTSPVSGKTAVPDFTTGEPYSVVNEPGYTYTWTITGGTIASGQGTSAITVDWGVAGDGTVSVVGSNGCGNAAAESIDIIIYYFIESAKSGNYGTNSTWVCNCIPTPLEAIRIMPAHSVRLTGNESIAFLEIRQAGTLNLNSRVFTVTEDVNIDGFVTGAGTLILSGNNKLIDGVGSIQNIGDLSITGGGKTIVSSAAFTKSNGNVTIANDISVTNNGVFALDGSMTGGNANSRFINAANATLSISGTLFSTGTLTSSSASNTVNYTGLLDQAVFPTSYHHLGASGDGIKSLRANADINGNLQISDLASLDVTVSDYTINIAGNWTNTSIDADPFVERTSSVTFDGSALQTLTAANGETFYNLIINSTGGPGVLLSGQVTISNLFTLTQGIVTLGAANLIGDNSAIVLNGGTFRTGLTTGYTDIAGTLLLTENSTIALGTGAHSLTFAASNGLTWTSGKSITINGWTGAYNGTSGTAGQIFIGNSAAGITAGQLSQIKFYDGNFYYTAAILATGEIVPSGMQMLITTNAISGSPFCEGSAVSVPYSITGTFNAGNIFTAQLSDASGSFASPVSIGTLASTAGGTVSGTIPLGTPAGTGYRIRVVSSTPAITGSINGIDITINNLPVATFSYTGSPYCPNDANPLPTFSGGGVAGTFSSTAGLIFVSASTGQVDLASSTPGTYTVTNTIDAAGGCGIVTATSPITISPELTWTGSVGSDWNTAGNWSCGYIPVSTTNVTIPDVPNKPVLNSGPQGASNHIVIDPGSSLTVSGNTIQISGSITNSGTFTAADGTIEMNGSGAQVIGAGIFDGNVIKDLIINNVAGVTLMGPLGITGIVRAADGSLDAGGNLTLLSTASQTALIDGSGTGSITGDVTLQRYLPSGFGYKYFSSPFQAATVNEFDDDMDLLAAFPSFYRYDESRASSGWVSYVNSAGVLNPLEGYAIQFGSGGAPVTVDVTGVVNDGSMSVTLYNNNNPFTLGFNLVGNPYPSPVDWDAASGWTKSNIDNALYYFKAGTTDQYGGTYSTYINGISSDGSATNVIPSMQGFFVHITDGSFPVTGSLGVDNNVRINDLTHAFLKSAGTDPRFSVRLAASFGDDPLSADPMVVYFDNMAAAGFDSDLDALKLMNTDLQVPNLYAILPEGPKLSIDALPEMSDTMLTIPLGLMTRKSGEIRFAIRDVENLLPGMGIYFQDKVTGISQDMLPENEYVISLASGEYSNRFYLRLLNNAIDHPGDNRPPDVFSVYSSNGLIKANIGLLQGKEGIIGIFDIVGHQVFIMKIFKAGSYEFDPQIESGIYMISYLNGNVRHTQKIFFHHK